MNRDRMRGRKVGGVLIPNGSFRVKRKISLTRKGKHSRRCFCPECIHPAVSRASEKRSWMREVKNCEEDA